MEYDKFRFMELSALEAFLTVARHQSFSRASESLHLTQPAVSKRVASLEAELGAKLFNRINRQISLTDAGSQLLPKAEELVNQAKELQRHALNLSDRINGTLSIGISHHIALYRMPPILKAFNGLHTDVDLDIRFEDSEQAFSSVERGDIEFAIITLPSRLPSNLVSEIAWRDELQIVVGLDHPLRNRKSPTVTNLAEYPSVLPTIETETHQIILREFERQGLQVNVPITTNNLQTLKMLAVAGFGWSLLPQTMLDGDLCVLDCNLTLKRNLGLVVHRKRSLSNAAKVMKKMIIPAAWSR